MLWMRVFLTKHPTLTERWKVDSSCHGDRRVFKRRPTLLSLSFGTKFRGVQIPGLLLASMQLALARQDVKERESSEDIPDALGWQLQPAPTLVLD